MDLQRILGDPKRYQDELDRLHFKLVQRRQLYQLRQHDVSFASLSFDRDKVARLLADTVSSGAYQVGEARPHVVEVGEKRRVLYSFCLTDRVIHGLMARVAEQRVEPRLSARLYSYRHGLQWWDALADFAHYIRSHARSHKNPRDRGLYVLRRDVRKYTDSVPVHARSAVWPLLKEALGFESDSDPQYRLYWPLIQGVVRPTLRADDGALYTNTYGLPTGSSFSTVLFNLYLAVLDEKLDAVPGAFYARYSDDILFAHPDPDLVRRADTCMREILSERELCTNLSKEQILYFNGAGRHSTLWPEARGTTAVPFLGCTVSFDGGIALNSKKVRRLLADLDKRARRTHRAMHDPRPDVAGPIVCRALSRALDPASPVRQKSAALLRRAVTDRRQLKQLDYSIARIVAQTVGRKSGVRAFRSIPYRTMRQDWKLVSLVHVRNLAGRRRGSHAIAASGFDHCSGQDITAPM